MVSIDGVEYVPTTGKRVRINDVEYAEVKVSDASETLEVWRTRLAKPAVTRIVDDEGNTWHLRNGGFVLWDMNDSPIRERSYILQTYGISDEY